MIPIDETIYCHGCGAEISWAPIMFKDRKYCCEDCAQGWICACGERMQLGDEYREEHHYPVTDGTQG